MRPLPQVPAPESRDPFTKDVHVRLNRGVHVHAGALLKSGRVMLYCRGGAHRTYRFSITEGSPLTCPKCVKEDGDRVEREFSEDDES